jgi:tetratricopeptide (TPR) repeat protein
MKQRKWMLILWQLWTVVAFMGHGWAQSPANLGMVELGDIEQLTLQYPDSAFVLLKGYFNSAQERNDLNLQATCLHHMGMVLYHLGNYRQALEHLLEAERIHRGSNNEPALALTLNSLGTVCYYNRQTEQAELHYREALRIYKSLKNQEGLAETYASLGRLHEKKMEYDSANWYQHQALALAAAANNTQLLARVYENMASVLEDKEQYDSAMVYYQRSLRQYRESGNRLATIEVINNLGDIYRKTNFVRESLVYSHEALSLSKLLQEKYQESSACRDLSKAFQILGQYDSAFYYLELNRNLIQEIYSDDNNRQTAVIQALFETERKNAEINRLEGKRKLNATLTLAAFLVTLLLGVLAALIIGRQKMRLKAQRAITEHQERVHIARQDLMGMELQNKQLQERQLQQELEVKSNELSSHILHLIQKNEVLEEIKAGLAEIIKDDKRDQKKQTRQLLQKINLSFSQDQYWEEFRLIFDKVHRSFFEKLHQAAPDLSATELRLLSLIKMNLSSGDISKLLGITPDSLRVTRYRVKKKLNLGQEESLTGYIQSL